MKNYWLDKVIAAVLNLEYDAFQGAEGRSDV